ncbi:hypothetical protein RchiOBHm_Chr2g0128311 [Rosa chinensis]|uniref:Uncharacterized protein n=1 Tax=Rosa chinensis TaxID=74649 RepID=A0A2P6RU94_ROSCH|nr:hypothetical protein RchiOBHm_Chr2g0128311 [Rosa chinensis]
MFLFSIFFSDPNFVSSFFSSNLLSFLLISSLLFSSFLSCSYSDKILFYSLLFSNL